MPAAIEVSNLVKRFGSVEAVRGITFEVKQGSTTALLGGNGAGKTTTIGMILGLVKPTSGTIHVLGHDIARARHKALPFMNFESPYVDLPKRLTVRQNLDVYAGLYGIRQVRERIESLSEQLDLKEFLDRPVGQLSAGQKTRVGLAKALLNRPSVLFLDEPTASLDPDTADWVRSLFESYRAETGASILLASHNMAEVERLCDHVVMMNRGQIVDEATPADLLAKYGRGTLEDVFLDIARGRGGNPETEVADAAQ